MRSRNESSLNARRIGRIGWLVWAHLAFVVAGFSGEGFAESRSDAGPASSFAELLAGFKETKGFEARFEEEKFLALLAAPLRSSGRLFFDPPSTLLRRVEKPRRQDILIRADQVRISDDSGEQLIDLAGRGGVRPLVESMIWIFTGDLDSLERTYRIDYQVLEDAEGEGQGWQVRLVPKEAPLSQLVQELRVSGQGRVADTMELIETTGDRTRTRIFDVDTQRRFDAAERRELFALP